MEGMCMAEGLTGGDITPCARHWTDHYHGYFQGAFMFGALHLCPPIPKGADPEEYRWEEGVEDNLYDLVPQIILHAPQLDGAGMKVMGRRARERHCVQT
jgi:hypothetical protein